MEKNPGVGAADAGTGEQWVSLPGQASMLRMEIRTTPASDGDGAELVRHRLRLPGTTAYRARIADAAGSVLSHVLLVVPSSDPHDDPLDQETNQVADARERADRELRNRLQGADEAKLEPTTALDPMLYCRHRRAFFRPRCLRTGDRLDECREDGLLDLAGVRRYPDSRRRFLFSSRVAQVEPDHLELVTEFHDPNDVGRVIDGQTLISRYGSLIEKVETIRRSEPAIAADMDEEFLCLKCPQRAECYRNQGVGDEAPLARARLSFFSARRWTPVVHPDPDLRYDEACRLLSGWDPDHIASYVRPRSSSPFAPPTADALRDFAESVTAEDAGWVLARKLALFETLVEQVGRVHERSGRAVLALRPDWIACDVISREPPTFATRLPFLAAGPCSEAGVEAASAPAAWLDREILPPEVMGAEARETVVASLVVIGLTEIASRESGFPYVRIELEPADRALDLDEVVAGDRFHLTLGDGAASGLAGFQLTCYPERRDGGRVVLVSTERKVNPEQARSLVQVRGRTLTGVFVQTERACEVSVDLFPLGIVLMWTLYGGEAVGPETVAALAKSARELFREGSFPDGFAEEPRAAIRAFCVENEAAWAMDPTRLLFRGFGVCPDDVPAELIDEVLELAFQLWTVVPGFSLCERRADVRVDDPGSFARELKERVTRLRRQAEACERRPPPDVSEIKDWLSHWCDPGRFKSRPARRKG